MTGPVPAGIAAGSSIWATKASTLFGAAASQASRPCRAAGPVAGLELAASRVMYQMLPAGEYPNTAAVAPHLYGSLEEQFAYGLDRLLDGLGIARDVTSRRLTPGQLGRQPTAARGETAMPVRK